METGASDAMCFFAVKTLPAISICSFHDPASPRHRKPHPFVMNKNWWILCLAALSIMTIDVDVARAQDYDDTEAWLRHQLGLRTSQRRDNAEMKRLVSPLSQSTIDSVVKVYSGDRPVALGTIVAAEGYVLTKRSELTGDPIRVRMSDNRLLPGRIAAVRRSSDLGLIKIESDETFTPVTWVDQTPTAGSFLISPGRTGRTIGIGAIGSRRVRVEHKGRLGVQLVSAERSGATVRGVQPGSGADQAGIEQGDRIVAINGRQQPDRFAVVNTLSKMYPGEVVALTIVRGEDRLEMDARLRDLSVLQETENDARVNGPRSARLSGFDDVFQHDTVLNPDECGGPILDSDGRVIGMNIARAGRVVSYALPASVIMEDLAGMLNEARGSVLDQNTVAGQR